MEQWRKDARQEAIIVDLDALVPQDHLLRKIEKIMDYEWLYERLDPYYCHDNGRPGTDPVVLIKMVLIQHLFGIPSLRQTYQRIQDTLSYRWFLGYPIEKITEETVAALTEPIQPQYLLLTLEQYNKIAEYFSAIGQTIVQNTDLISELPTYQDVNDLTVQEIRPYLTDMRTMTADKLNSIESSTKQALSKQTTILSEQLQKELNRMTSQLKARDLTPWKLRLKWMALGAILPSMVCILLLILR